MKQRLLLTWTVLLVCLMANAQEWMNVHSHYGGETWTFPLRIDKMQEFYFSGGKQTMTGYTQNKNGLQMAVPFSVAHIDSISFTNALTDEEKGHDKYRVFTLSITTEGEANIVEKEVWLNCHFSLDGKGEYSNYSGTGRIRGRGNSSWLYYAKKPYKFKLDTKSKLLGLEKAKNWNLLSNYRDVTDMMNVLAFETARWMGLPFTNHTRFVEVFLNGEYIGVYQLTEKIEIGMNRVNIDEQGGLLMSFDVDDGPAESSGAGDNFWSKWYKLPMCVKEPENLTEEQIDSIRADFAVLEKAVKAHDYALVDSLMDIPSFIGILQLHEYLYNVEIDAPRSLYMFKDKGGKYTFGPVWDWDAAYDFDWNNWERNHTYFSDCHELIYGTDPLGHKGAAYEINLFFRDLFGNRQFVSQYKRTWAERSDSIYLHPWAEVQKYIDEMNKGVYVRDTEAWPLEQTDWWETKTFKPSEEIAKMSKWLQNRKKYLDGVIAAYPAGNDEVLEVVDPADLVVVGIIRKTQACTFSRGYSQLGQIAVAESEVTSLLGGVPDELVPLDSTGEEGTNTAARAYGAWFDEDGDTNAWAVGHVYIESNDLYSWAYGCHPDNCGAGERHTVTMQYRRGSKAVNVEVTFNVQ